MRRDSRAGYTLMELLVVLALLIIVGMAVLPTLEGMYGNTRAEAGVDAVRHQLADARALAVEQGEPYRVAVSTDGRTLRLAPERDFDTIQSGAGAEGQPAALAFEAALPDRVTARVEPSDGSGPGAGAGDWVTIATFLQDGTCREPQSVVVTVAADDGGRPLRVRVRGLTGVVDSLGAEAQP